MLSGIVFVRKIQSDLLKFTKTKDSSLKQESAKACQVQVGSSYHCRNRVVTVMARNSQYTFLVLMIGKYLLNQYQTMY